jgi:hypothetical protein
MTTKETAINMPTLKELRARFDCDATDARDIDAILAQAELDGAAKKYGTGDFASDAWFDDVGLDIEQFEVALLLDDGELLSLYKAAYRRGLERAPARAA